MAKIFYGLMRAAPHVSLEFMVRIESTHRQNVLTLMKATPMVGDFKITDHSNMNKMCVFEHMLNFVQTRNGNHVQKLFTLLCHPSGCW